MTTPKIKLVACDMDGTLLNDAKEMPSDFIPWVQNHPDTRVVIASGRQYATLLNDFKEIKNSLYFLADNGALVFYQGKLIHIDEIEKSVIADALKILSDIKEIVPIVCGAESAYMQHASEEAGRNAHMYYKRLRFLGNMDECLERDKLVKIACFIEYGNADELISRLNRLHASVEAVISGDKWIDIMKRGVNKGTGLKAIQSKYNISPDESMAFGDYLNDYELLMSCTESYAMDNGHPKLKQIAKHIAPSNEDNGVMQVLNEEL